MRRRTLLRQQPARRRLRLRTRAGARTGWPISCRRRGSIGTACRLERSQGCSPRITSSGPPSPPSRSGMSASGAMPRLMGMRSADMRRAEMPPPTGASSFRPTFDRAITQATDRRATRDRHPQPLTAFHATVPTASEKSGFKAGSSRRDKSGLERGQEAPRHLHDRAASSPTSSGGCSS